MKSKILPPNLSHIMAGYFDEEEIEKIYDALKYQGIEILIIESQNSFHSLPQENLYILDKDMCEIVEER